jgi:hypothetical protein
MRKIPKGVVALAIAVAVVTSASEPTSARKRNQSATCPAGERWCAEEKKCRPTDVLGRKPFPKRNAANSKLLEARGS